MKVLLINGSPNEKGCTYTALKEFKDTLKEENIDSDIFMLELKLFPLGELVELV